MATNDRDPSPEPRLVTAVESLPPSAASRRALDVASGAGRNALWLAQIGYHTHAIDRSADRLAELRALATAMDLPITTEERDLETTPPPDLGDQRYDLIVVVNYLHRPLAPRLVTALAPGGILFYETFTVDQAAYGRPSNPDFLLTAGELPRLFAALTVIDYREGVVEGPAAKATLGVETDNKRRY